MSKFRLLLLLALFTGRGCFRLVAVARSPAGTRVAALHPFRPCVEQRFRATNYEIRASLDAVGQVMNAQAKVDFAASEAASSGGRGAESESAREFGARCCRQNQ